MDSDRASDGLARGAYRRLDLVRQAAAVGVAQANQIDPGVIDRLQA